MRKKLFLFSLRTKLFVTFLSVAVLITMAMTYGLYNHMRTDHINILRRELMGVAAVASLQIDGDMLEQLVSLEHENKPEYIEIRNNLTNIADKIPNTKYIYTMRKTQQPEQYAFIVDADPNSESATHIGDYYDGRVAPMIAEGFINPSADQVNGAQPCLVMLLYAILVIKW